MKNKNGYSGVDIGLDLAFHGAAIGVAGMLSITSLAPYLSPKIKNSVNEIANTDIDQAHIALKNGAYSVLAVVQHFSARALAEEPKYIREPSDRTKCRAKQGQSIQIGDWVFHLGPTHCK